MSCQVFYKFNEITSKERIQAAEPVTCSASILQQGFSTFLIHKSLISRSRTCLIVHIKTPITLNFHVQSVTIIYKISSWCPIMTRFAASPGMFFHTRLYANVDETLVLYPVSSMISPKKKTKPIGNWGSSYNTNNPTNAVFSVTQGCKNRSTSSPFLA